MKTIFGIKGRMTQVFSEAGVTPATVITASPMTVTQVKTTETDGYSALQVGFGTQKEHRHTNALRGHLKEFATVRHLKEVTGIELPRGGVIDLSAFAVGDLVSVSAVSKGKGFQGVVKRHGFKGGPRSHGQKNKERAPGSIGGAGRAGGRVTPGMRMAGRMGGERITVRNLRVVQVDPATHTILISGAVPGKPGSLVEIRSI